MKNDQADPEEGLYFIMEFDRLTRMLRDEIGDVLPLPSRGRGVSERRMESDEIVRSLKNIARTICKAKPPDPKTIRRLVRVEKLPAKRLPGIGWVARRDQLRMWTRERISKQEDQK